MIPKDLISKLLNSILEDNLERIENRTKSEMEDLKELSKGFGNLQTILDECSLNFNVSNLDENSKDDITKSPLFESSKKEEILQNGNLDHIAKNAKKSRNPEVPSIFDNAKTLKPNRTTANLESLVSSNMNKLTRTIDKSTDKKDKTKRSTIIGNADEGQKVVPKTPKKSLKDSGDTTKKTMNPASSTTTFASSTSNLQLGLVRNQTATNLKTPTKKNTVKTIKDDNKVKNTEEDIKKDFSGKLNEVKKENAPGATTNRASKLRISTKDLTKSAKKPPNPKKLRESGTSQDKKNTPRNNDTSNLDTEKSEDNVKENEVDINVNVFNLEENNKENFGSNNIENISLDKINHKEEIKIEPPKKIIIEEVKKLPNEYLVLLDNNNQLNLISLFFNKIDNTLIFPSSKIIGRYSLIRLMEESKKELEDAEIRLKTHMSKNPNDSIPSEDFPPFVMTRGANRAIDLLNENMYNKIFSADSNPSDDIKLIYRIYFYFINKKDIYRITNSNEFWRACSHYFITEGNGKTGTLINNSVKNFDFSLLNVYKIYKLIEKQINKIAPAYFSKLCGTTGLFIFLIKDALEYTGIIFQDKKTPSGRVLQNLRFAVEFNKEKLKRIDCLLEGAYRKID